MKVYRVGNTKFATELSGEGARLHGGRWNQVGTPCLYTSQSRALAILELSVNVSTGSMLRYLSMVEIEIPDNFVEVKIAELPGNWRESPAPASTKDYGTALFNRHSFPVFKIPSAVVPEEFNYLVNSLHPDAVKCQIIEVKDFVYDVRIKKS